MKPNFKTFLKHSIPLASILSILLMFSIDQILTRFASVMIIPENPSGAGPGWGLLLICLPTVCFLALMTMAMLTHAWTSRQP